MYSDTARVLLTGDFCPINRIEDLALKRDYSSVYNDFIDVIRDNDLVVTDLECPLTLSESARIKYGPHQKAHPDTIHLLEYANIGLAAMANNHMMDFGSKGAADTLALCCKSGIGVVGIGESLAEARKPYSLEIKGKKVAFLNYADNEFITSPDGAFVCNTINEINCYYDIRELRTDHQFVIVIIHAGNEFYGLPAPRTKKLYRYLIDLGADVVVSHHTHVFSGFEIYKSKPVFYGLGNFIYDWPGKREGDWNTGFVVRLLLSDKVTFEIIPIKHDRDLPGVTHMNSKEREDFENDLNRKNQIIQDDILLKNEFRQYCLSVFPMYNAFIEPNFGRLITYLRRRGLFPNLVSGRKRLLLLNLSRCDSHREVLIRLLSEYEQEELSEKQKGQSK